MHTTPGGDEQSKIASTRNRSTRSKSDTTTTDSQEQEGRLATRRRAPSGETARGQNAAGVSTPATPPAARGQNAAEVSTPATPPAARSQNAAGVSTPATPPAARNQNAAGVSTPATPPAARSTAAQRTQETRRPAAGSSEPVQRPAPMNRVGGNPPHAPRVSTTSAPAATGQAPMARPSNPTGPGMPSRPGYGQRPNPNFAPATRQPNGQPTQRPMQRQHGAQPIQRPANPAPGTARPGTQGHPAAARPSTPRPTTPAQRPQDRRASAAKTKPTGPISIPPQIVVKDLAELLHATPNEIIRGLIKHSIFASINQVVDYEKAALVAQELGFEPSQGAITAVPAVQSERGLSANEAMIAQRDDDNTVVIPPVVTIMGHVDHGKTSLLDTIRKTKVAAGEAGGITQHIGAYQVEVEGKKITFLDTPGHEAFTAMRARGAQVTHIAVIVVAADDGVMPQTREAIDHARAAKVPIIIALNKIDKANANPDHVKQQLAEIGVVIEEFGGDVVCVPVSARRGTGIDELLEMILLVAEVQDIKANPNRLATGVIIEAKLEKSIGPTATVLIQQGTLKMGDNIVVGALAGKIRAMFNDRGKRIQKAPPSMPVSILGLPDVPMAGDRLEVVSDERTAKQLALKVAEQRRSETMPLGQVSLDTLYMQMQEGKVKELDVVLKSDVQGSSEAIKNALSKVGEENIKVRLIHEGIGNINETDVHLASASGAVIIGFNVKADGAAQRLAQKEDVEIRYYNIIYKLIDDIQAALTGMLEPSFREVVEGHAEVIQTFKAGKNMVIAGCRITDGKISRSSQVRVMRKTSKVFEGKIGSLRRGKDDVREVASGYECGIVLEDFVDFEVGDIVESFTQERVKAGS
jgi:translation initiation factor IF-2